MKKYLIALVLLLITLLLPLVHAADYTCGYTGIGSSENQGESIVFYRVSLEVPSGYVAKVSNMSVYLRNDTAGVNAQVGIYDSNCKLVASSSQFLVNGLGWYTVDVTANLLNGTYWLAVGFDGLSTYRFYTDDGVSNSDFQAVSIPLPANAALSDWGTYAVSIYFTYDFDTITDETTNWNMLIYVSVMFFLVIANIFLAGSKKSPILGFIFGIVSICVVAVAAGQSANIPFYPLPNVLLGLVAVVTLFSSGLSLRGS